MMEYKNRMKRTRAFSLKEHGSSDQWEAAEGKSICFCFLGNLLPSKPVIQLMVVGRRLELSHLSHLATPWTGRQCARPVQGSFVEPTACTYSCAGALHVNYSVVVSWCFPCDARQCQCYVVVSVLRGLEGTFSISLYTPSCSPPMNMLLHYRRPLEY